MAGPIERKAAVAPAGALGGAVAGFLLYLLGRWVYGGPVPDDVQSTLLVVVPAVVSSAGAFAAAWRAHHTPRSDLASLRSPPRK